MKKDVRLKAVSEGYSSLWTFTDLARFLKVSESKVRHDTWVGKIPCIRIGKSVRFNKNK